MNKPYYRLLIAVQAFLFAAFGIILKNLDDSLGDKLLWAGVAVLALVVLKTSLKMISKRKESA